MGEILRCGLRLRGTLLVLVGILAGCGSGGGGGGGGGGLSASIILSPSSTSATFYSKEVHEFSMDLELRGTVADDDALLVVIDSGAVIQEDFEFAARDADLYRLTFKTSAGLEPGRRQNQLDIRICDTDACGRTYASARFSYDFNVLPYPVPVLDNLSPSSVLIDSSATDITVTGSSFTHASVVRWDGEPLTTQYISATQLVANVPAALLTAARAVPVTVSNPTPGGGISSTRNFSVVYPVPEMSGMSAVEAAAGCGSFQLRVGGQGLFPVTTLLWNGSPRPTTFLSAGLLSAEISAADLAAAGSATVSLRNPAPGGGVGAGEPFGITASAPPTTDSVAFHINAQHTGRATTRCPVTLPETRAWRFPVNFAYGYPLIADGKVYFYQSGPGLPLYALNAANGSIVWGPVNDENANGSLAYDDGRLFVPATFSIVAFNAANGNLIWRQSTTPRDVLSGITAANGALYFSLSDVNNRVQALKQSDGSSLWTRAVQGGYNSVPAVNAEGVFVTYPCFSYRLSVLDGTVTWKSGASCASQDDAAGGTPVLGADRLLAARGSSYGGRILRVDNGAGLGNYAADSIPAVAPGVRVALQESLSSPVVRAHNDDGTLRWSFQGTPDDLPFTAPVIVNDLVFVGTVNERVWALDLRSGTPLWFGELGGHVSPPPGVSATAYATGLSAGGGVLVVPTVGGLSAFDLGGRE